MSVRLHASDAEQVYSGVTYFSAAGMMMLSASLILWVELPPDDKPLAAGGALLVAFLVWFAAMGRLYIVDWVRQLSHQERSVMAVVAAVAFVFPSVILGRWTPLAGLLILHIPACLGLVSAPGFAQAYLLGGVSLIFISNSLPEPVALLAWAAWLMLLCVTCCAENYLHTFRAHSYGIAGSPFVAVCRGVERFALAALLTTPLALTTPPVQPLRVSGASPGLNRPAPSPLTGPVLDPSSPTWLYLLLGLFVVLVMSVFLFILVRRLRKNLGAAAPLDGGIPMGIPVIRPLELQRQKRKPGSNARDQIARLYERMSDALEAIELGRKPEQTATEYADRLARSGRMPADLSAEVTREFVIARYAPEEPTRQDVERFRKLVRQAVAAATKGAT